MNATSHALAAERVGTAGVPRYWLPRHVHVCSTADGVVFLNLKKDKYLGVPLDQLGAVSALIENLPACVTLPDIPPLPFESRVDGAEAFAAAGLLTRQPSRADLEPRFTPEPIEMMPVGFDAGAPGRSIGVMEVANFITAATVAAAALRFCTLGWIVERMRARKREAGMRRDERDTQSILDLSLAYRRLRTYAYTSRDHCLFHALALTIFLAKYEYFPTWVIGVTTDPFTAHSWVQIGCFVLDDNPEEVCLYTPILAV